MQKLVFLKSNRNFPIGHITTTKTGQKIKKVSEGKWVPVSGEKSTQNKNISGLIFKDGFYYDGKVKITNNYEKAKKYIDKKEENKPTNTQKEEKNVKVGDVIHVKANSKKGGVRESKVRGLVAKVQSIQDGIVKIIDDAGKVFQVQKTALEFAKSNEWILNDFNLIKSYNKYLNVYNPEFIKKFKDICLNGCYKKLPKVEGFPKGLDLENFEILFIGDNYIKMTAGGDWQQMINFSFAVEAKNQKPIIIDLYNDGSKSDNKKISEYLNTIKDNYENKDIQNKDMKKSTKLVFNLCKGKSYPVGTIREYSGKKYQKQSNGKWTQIKKKPNNKKEKFIDWFKGSKVVDESGKPLIVYHGTAENFESFDKEKIGQNYNYSEDSGFFFTQKEQSAKNYAKLHTGTKSEGKVFNVYLNIKKPLIREINSDYLSPASFFDDHSYELTKEAKNSGKDGIIIKGTRNDSLYIVFEPNQIKSVDAKDFDSNSNNIYKSNELQTGMKIEKEHLNTIKEIKKKNLNDKQSTKLIAKDHIKEAKDKGYNYYKRLIAAENLEDYKGVEKKIIEYIKSHNFIKDETGIHKFAKELGINPHKLKEKIYAILKDIVGNEIKKSKSLIFNFQKARSIKYIKRIPKSGGGYKYIYKENQNSSDKSENNKQDLKSKFKKWFGDSKVVDEKGNPKKIFHGTSSDFENFIPKSDNYGNPKAIYFSDSKTNAKKYGQVIKEVFVKMENPLEIDMEGESYHTDKGYYKYIDAIKEAENEGYDGVIAKNMIDTREPNQKGKPSTIYVVFDENNIKEIKKNEVRKSSNLAFNLIKSKVEGIPKILTFSDLKKNNEEINKLDKIKKILLSILDKQMEKSFTLGIFDLIKGKAYPIGTKREWENKKFIKVAKGKWRRFYEGESRGQKQSISYIKKQIENAKTISELAKIVFENRKRFTNQDGTTHNIVKQLLEIAKEKKQGRGKDKQKRKEKETNNIKKSENKTEIDVNFLKYGTILRKIKEEIGDGDFDKNSMKYSFSNEKLSLVYSKLSENIKQWGNNFEEKDRMENAMKNLQSMEKTYQAAIDVKEFGEDPKNWIKTIKNQTNKQESFEDVYKKTSKQEKYRDEFRPQFKQFVDIVKNSKNYEEAFNKILKIKNVPKDTSELFARIYMYKNGKKLTPKEAFKNFYNDVRK